MKLETETTEEAIARILAPAIDTRAPYAKLMITKIAELLAERAAPLPAIPESAMEELYRTGSAMMHTHVPGEAWRAPEPAPLPAEVISMIDRLGNIPLKPDGNLDERQNLLDRSAAAIFLKDRWPKEAGWQPISTAPKDGTWIVVRECMPDVGLGPQPDWIAAVRWSVHHHTDTEGWLDSDNAFSCDPDVWHPIEPLPPAPKEGE